MIKNNIIKYIIITNILLLLTTYIYASENIIIVIIDGARYSETLGDESAAYVPRMAAMAEQGTVIDYFYNDSLTYTSRAIPALWCGTWTEVLPIIYNGNSTNYVVQPTIFEYYRKHLNKSAAECFYVLKQISSLWLASCFDGKYGPDYWPTYHSSGATDEDVGSEAQWVMDNYHPPFLLVYLADVDSRGHSGDWNGYTQAIQIADSITGLLWQKVQTDPFYKDKTSFFVTNDHGRHDDQHGGFSGHGDDCDGCRHIEFLALGPTIKSNFHSSVPRSIPDMAVTAGAIMGFETPMATGDVMTEILNPTNIISKGNHITDFVLYPNFPNPFNPSTTITYSLKSPGEVIIKIYDVNGRAIKTLLKENKAAGKYSINFSALDLASGIYFYSLKMKWSVETRKMILMK